MPVLIMGMLGRALAQDASQSEEEPEGREEPESEEGHQQGCARHTLLQWNAGISGRNGPPILGANRHSAADGCLWLPPCLMHLADDFIQKGTKLPRDPNAPAPKVSAYMYFSQEKREEMAKKKGPALDFTAAGTAIGKAWSELGEVGKKPYEAKAAKDAQRFEKEMAKYKPSAKFAAELEACKKSSKYQPRLKKVRADRSRTTSRHRPAACAHEPAFSLAHGPAPLTSG